MNTKIESFSGTHAFRPDCVKAHAEFEAVTSFGFPADQVSRIGDHWAEFVEVALITSICPRCRQQMDLDRAAGSRITNCRCIPICSDCGSDEAHYLTPVWRWPTSKTWPTRRRNKLMEKVTVTTAFIANDMLVTEDGFTPVRLRPHPGGWAESGMDEEVGA